jgi:glycolate oxidase iron-sulfur subunit
MDRQKGERQLEEKTLRCIRCGFCLEACPTFVVTGKETESPRGRIYLVRSALEGVVSWRTGVLRHLETCVGCRACEPACPSGVEYGAILEMARERLNKEERKFSLARLKKRGLLFVLMRPYWLRVLSRLYGLWGVRGLLRGLSGIFFGGRGVPMPAPEPRSSFSKDYPPAQRRVYFLEGCVMSALFPATNEATVHLLREAGCEVVRLRGCCGALALHLGYKEEGRKGARALLRQWEWGVPVVTNSAGCGSAMKEYHRVFEGEGEWESRAESFARNVYDFTEFLYKIGWRGGAGGAKELVVTYQDACHLVHGQGVREDPRALISSLRNVRLVEMRDSDRCCGSGGIYNVLQPDLAWALLERKWLAIRETGARLVLVGNPGCVAWLQQAPEEWRRGIEVMHTALFLARWGSS